MGGACSTYVED